jgi:hypothetical protein
MVSLDRGRKKVLFMSIFDSFSRLILVIQETETDGSMLLTYRKYCIVWLSLISELWLYLANLLSYLMSVVKP